MNLKYALTLTVFSSYLSVTEVLQIHGWYIITLTLLLQQEEFGWLIFECVL